MPQGNSSVNDASASASVATTDIRVEELNNRRKKAAQDLIVRQNFRLPQSMGAPAWAKALDKEIATRRDAVQSTQASFEWPKLLRPSESDRHELAEHASWMRKLREDIVETADGGSKSSYSQQDDEAMAGSTRRQRTGEE
jgi:hypothetical protein